MVEHQTAVRGVRVPRVLVWSIIAIAVLIAMLYLTNAFWRGETTMESWDTDAKSGHGRIYLSLAERGESRSYPYVLDVASRELHKIDDGSEAIMLLHNFSGDKVSFIGTTVSEYERQDGASNKAYQLYVAPASEKDAPTLTAATRVTVTDQYAKRAPDLSPDGNQLLYSVLPRADSVVLDEAEAWDVYVVSASGGTPELVTRGVFPKWLSNEAFVVLKNDGLHVYNIRTSNDEMLWEVEGAAALSNMMLHVSEDRHVIAWTAPDAGRLMVVRIQSLDPLDVSGDTVDGVNGFWPVVSPDGSFVALQGVDWGAVETDPKPEIRFYDTETLSLTGTSVDLSAFDQGRMFMTDWRE